MTTSSTATPLDPRLSRIAAEIHAEIPGCEVRLFGSRARGTARLDSDADLLITVPDGWLAGHDRLPPGAGSGPTESPSRVGWCGHAGAGFVGTAPVRWPTPLPLLI